MEQPLGKPRISIDVEGCDTPGRFAMAECIGNFHGASLFLK